MSDNRAQLVREAVVKLGAAGSGETTLERGPHSLVALLHSAYLTTGQVTHRIRVVGRLMQPLALPRRFLKPMAVTRQRIPRRSPRS